MLANQRQTSADQPQTPEEKYYKDKGYSASDVALAIIGAGVANAIALVAINTPFTLWNTIVGIIILCILSAYVPAPTASTRLFVAYAAAWSISILSSVGIIFNIIFELSHGSFPNFESTAPFYSLPYTLGHFLNQHYVIIDQKTGESVQAFTPINIYDLAFFSAWALVFVLCFLYLYYRRRRCSPQSVSPKEKPQPGLETPRGKESGTPTLQRINLIPRDQAWARYSDSVLSLIIY